MNKYPFRLLLFIGLFMGSVAHSAENYVSPQTEWGQSDLQGVWNFSVLTS
jgi:hypothetical protein